MFHRMIFPFMLLSVLAGGCALRTDAPEFSPPIQEESVAEATAPTESPATQAPSEPETEVPTEPETEAPTEPLPAADEITLRVQTRDDRTNDTFLTDGSDYTPRYISGPYNVVIRADAPMHALYIRWDKVPGPYTLCWDGGTLACGEEGFLHEYIVLPEDASEVWIEIPEGELYGLNDIRAFTYGTPPDNVQTWHRNDGHADILAFPTHADDELLFFGPLLAYYINERGLEVQMAYMTTHNTPLRDHERLDGLWKLGVRSYPFIGPWPDIYVGNLAEAKLYYSTQEVTAWQVELIRRYQPMVIIGHDQQGEYGHGAHRLNTYCLISAVPDAADPEKYADSAERYGVWDTPKLYLHLEETDQIVFPIDEPMESCGGLTPYQLASKAYALHVTQQKYYSYIWREETPECDCRLFGLYRSTVGSDSGWDIWENVPQR